MEKLCKKLIVTKPQGLNPGGKAFQGDNKNVSEYKNDDRSDTRGHLGKSENRNHEADVCNSKSGNPHKRERIGKIAAENLEQFDNPLQQEV